MGGGGLLMLTASCAAAALLLWAMAQDLRCRLIPDWISLSLAGLAFPWLALDAIPVGPLSALAAVALTFCAGLAVFARGWLGGGDVKLMAAFAAWCGLEGLPAFLLLTSLSGGVMAIGWATAAAARRRLMRTAAADMRVHSVELPYAVAIAAGGIGVLLLRIVSS